MDRVVVTAVHNPFDPLTNRETRVLEPDRTIGQYVAIFYPEAIRDGYDLAISINGEIMEQDDLGLRVRAGNSLAFCLVPQGGGGGKNILRVVAMIAVIVLSVYTGGLVGTAYGSMYGALAGVAVSVAGNMLVNAILPYQNMAETGSLNTSPTYGWDTGQNYLYEGGPLPILYGKRRVTPPVIAKHIETIAGENNQYLSVLMAICEGEITEISNNADALRSNVRINRVAAANYKGLLCEMRKGANAETSQQLVQDFTDTYTDTPVGIKLTDNSSWQTRTTAGTACETIGVNFSAPAGIGAANGNGGLDNVIVRIQVEFKKQGDSVWTRWTELNQYPISITTGRWSAGYWGYAGSDDLTWIELEAGTASGHYENEPYVPVLASEEYAPTYIWHWVASETIVGAGSIPIDHLTIQGAQTSAVRKGWKTPVPAGKYDIRARLEDAYATGTGVMADVYWDMITESVPDDFIYPNTALLAIRALATDQLSGGFPTIDIEVDRGNITLPTFGSKPSSNPAWACVDLLTSERYGGGVSIGRIDTAAFQAWADFCDANSYTVNLYIDQAISVRAALNMISQLGRATVIQLGSKFTVIVDKIEGTPVQRFMFNVGNIVTDSFKERWLPQDDRANAVEVEYYDKDQDYERTPLTVYADDFDTTALEVKSTSLILYGCTDRAMAIKHAKFLLNCNRYLTLSAEWDADIDALACFPGDIVEVQHDIPQWGVGGRVVSSTASSITLDRPVTIVAGTYHIRVKHQDDDTFEEKTVTDGAGTYTTLNISGTWTKNPAQYALYSFGLINFVVKLFRVLRISRAGDLRRRITAIEYYEPIYTDTATVPAPDPWPTPTWVSNLRAAEIYKEGSTSGVALSWSGYATPFSIYVRRLNETTFRFLGESYGNSFQAFGFDTGVEYVFMVTPSSNPNAGDGATVTITMGGRSTLPAIATPAFDDARCTYTDKIQLEWLAITDPLLGYYELRTDLNWGTADGMTYQGKATSYTMKPTGASYTFYLKSHDTFGNYSAGYDTINLTITVPTPIFTGIDGSKFGRVLISWQPMNDEYFDVVEVWRNTVNDRTNGGTFLVGEIHASAFADTTVAVGTTYYYWLRTKSIFGTYSAWSTGDTAGHTATTATINSSDLADAVITSMKLAPNIKPPEIVDFLPTLPDSRYPVGMLVFYTGDMKLYRNRAAGYEAGTGGGGGPTSGWTDSFDRADGALGANWIPWGNLDLLRIESYLCARSGTGDSGMIWANTPSGPQFSQAICCSLGDPGVGVRVQPSSFQSGYICEVQSGAGGQFILLSAGSTNGNLTTVKSWAAAAFAPGDTLYLSASGSYLTVKRNTTIVGSATDTLYSSGLCALYVSGGATRVDSWMCGNGADVSSGGGGGSPGWLDDFDRADGAVGSGWIGWGDLGPLRVVSNVCARSFTTGDGGGIWTNTPGANQFAQVIVCSLTDPGVAVRVQPTSFQNGYLCEVMSGAGGQYIALAVGSSTNGNWTLVKSWGSPSFVAGDTLYLSASGSHLTVKKNTTIIGSATDTLYSTGLIGLYVSGGATRVDSFFGGNL